MGLSAHEIAAVLREIAPVLTAGWIQKVHQPAPRAIILEIRTPGRTHSLYLSADPEAARLHLTNTRYSNPPSPPPFCQFLRAHIQGARMEALEQVPQDRIVSIQLMARNGPCSLIAELTGRGADLLLTDAEGKILTALDGRRKQPGETYHPPVRRTDAPAAGVSAPSVQSGADPGFPISEAVEQQYCRQELELAAQRARQATITDLKKRLKKVSRRVEALTADLEKASRYREYARYGELLKANLHQMRKGQDRLTVIDYFDPALPELVLPLETSKGPHANMEDYFKKYRKHLAAEKEVRPRLQAEERQMKALRTELADVERGTWQPTSSAVSLSRSSPSPLRQGERVKKKGSEPRSGPFRRFQSMDGLPIYVGRNAQENELLTFGEARPDDLWLHAHGTPGSHVVLRTEKGADPPPDSIRDAATLALLYSDLKKSGKGDVLYTRKKYVRKVKAKSPGTVTVTQEKTLFVTLDRIRLDRLKSRSG
ncbi:MAG TPA: NFACT family protein [Nitrospiraceae bacterium]|nr:NFACT family protein [Nitrospiraceae bacterium]